jgi:hypothetical protein
MNKTLVTVKVEKAGKSVLDWYSIFDKKKKCIHK